MPESPSRFAERYRLTESLGNSDSLVQVNVNQTDAATLARTDRSTASVVQTGNDFTGSTQWQAGISGNSLKYNGSTNYAQISYASASSVMSVREKRTRGPSSAASASPRSASMSATATAMP